MALSKEAKETILSDFGRHEKDSGSSEVQIALLTKRVNELTEHFKTHKKDFHSLRGLLKIVGQRRRLLSYMRRTNLDRYRTLITDLGLRG